jgi:calpain-15
VVFNEDIDPNDINQGEIGNCYFLAVLSACAENPRRIRDRVKIQQVNGAGIYCVTMYINGVETPIIVDDYFPTVYGRPAFCKTKEGEIWAMLFEKAWAKVHGSYCRTEGGQTAHASQHMIGLPAFTYSHTDLKVNVDKFWKSLMKFDKMNFVMLSSSTAGTNDEYVDGIVQGHAYALLSVHQFEAHGSTQKLIKMRNPWGKQGEWNGDWSDNSNLWTDELRE